MKQKEKKPLIRKEYSFFEIISVVLSNRQT